MTAELERIRESLGRLAVMRAEGEVDEREFASARSLQRRRQEKLEAQLERETRRLESDARQTLLETAWEDLQQLTTESWASLPVQHRRDIVELVIERIVVDPVSGHNPTRMPAHKRVRIRWR
jgi:hypothetical protein